MISRRFLLSTIVAAPMATQPLPPTQRTPPASPDAAPGVTYRDITVAAGLSGFRHVSGSKDKNYIIEATGSGAALWDFDNDGYIDIYLVNGSTLDRLERGAAAPSAALFRNNGDGTFTDVTVEHGVANERWGQGVCVGDFDNDGFEDLYVTNFGKNRLYRGDKRGRFRDVAEEAGVAGDGWSTGCAFGDYDGDGWLDLFVAGYVSLDLRNLPPPATAARPGSTLSQSSAPAARSDGGSSRMGASYSPGAAVCTYRGERVM